MAQFIFLFILVIIFAPFSTNAADFLTDIEYLKSHSIKESRAVEVTDLEIGLTYGKALLVEGEFYLTGYLENIPTAAFFIGDGYFIYNPPDEIEKQQIRRFYKSDSIYHEFEMAYFAFPQNADIFGDLPDNIGGQKASSEVKIKFSRAREIPDKSFNYNLPFRIYKASYERAKGYLYADFIHDDYHHTIYSYSPESDEEVSVYKIDPKFINPQLVSSLPDNNAGKKRDYDYEIDVVRYDIDIDVSTYQKSQIACQMSFEIKSDSLKYVDFSFPPEYRVDSVTGDAANFIKDKDRPELLLELSQFFYKNDTAIIKVYYRTNLFRHYMLYGVTQDNLTHWYPYNGYRQLSIYDATYHIDKDYDFLAVGESVSDSIADGRQHLRFRSPEKIAYISFNYGLFDSVAVHHKGVPITLYYLSSKHSSPIFGNDIVDEIAGDIEKSFEFYSDKFADYQFDRLDVDAMAVGYGQGSPGVVHLSEVTFNRSTPGVDDKFRAHEVAHQWWGHLVNPRSYRDVWLSEGLAEYSAAMYVELIKGNKKAFKDILKRWKRDVVKGGKLHGRKSVGYKAGPVVLGNRLRSELSPGDFAAIIYYKAAYILHMLRFELNASTGNDEAFFDLLAEYAEMFKGKKASTRDFVNVASKYLGGNTDRFFDQWLYGWKVPKIKCKSKRQKDGSAKISIEVKEFDSDFKTNYPVRITYSDKTMIKKIFPIKYGINEFIIESNGENKITGIDFNPNYDILEQ